MKAKFAGLIVHELRLINRRRRFSENDAFGPHIGPILLDPCQTPPTITLGTNHCPTSRRQQKAWPQRVLSLVIHQYAIDAVFGLEWVRQRVYSSKVFIDRNSLPAGSASAVVCEAINTLSASAPGAVSNEPLHAVNKRQPLVWMWQWAQPRNNTDSTPCRSETGLPASNPELP
jgi:hypothetical protein